MSLQIDFNFYAEGGELISTCRYTSVTVYDDYINLNVIHKRLFESFNHPMTLNDPKWRYASPTHITSYMFDLQTGELLPNRFVKRVMPNE